MTKNTISNFLLNIQQLYNFLSKKNKIKTKIIIAGMVVSMLLEVLSLGVVYPVIKIIVDKDSLGKLFFFNKLDFLKNIESANLIVAVLMILIVVFLIKNTFLFLFTIYKNYFLQDFLSDMRIKFYNMYLKLKYENFIKRNSSEMLRNIQECTIALRSFDAILSLLAETLILFGIIIILMYFSLIPTLAIIFVSLLFFFIYLITLKKKIFLLGKERFYLDNLLIKQTMEGFGSYRDIILYNANDIFLNEFSGAVIKNNKNLAYTAILSQVTRIFLEQFGVIVIVALAIFLFMTTESFNTSLPILGAYVYAFFKILPSVNKIVVNMQAIINSKAAVNDLSKEIKICEIDQDNKNLKIKTEIKKFNNKINLTNVTFKQKDRIIFDKINLNINCKDKIGIMGPSGSGKSTLLNLIMGFLKPNSGTIKFDGYDIDQFLNIIRKQIGCVSQSIYLLDDTIRNNITLKQKKESIDYKKLDKVIEFCGLENFLSNAPQGYETIMGERGVFISGGELQRIGIARALYNDKEILLFDEFTNQLDDENEEKILQQVNKLDKTIVMISHKLSTLKYCNKLVTIKNKKITELKS